MSDTDLPPSASVPKSSGLAICGLVLGMVTCPLAIAFGWAALGQIKQSNGRLDGKGMAVAGLVLGCLSLVWWTAVMYSAFTTVGWI